MGGAATRRGAAGPAFRPEGWEAIPTETPSSITSPAPKSASRSAKRSCDEHSQQAGEFGDKWQYPRTAHGRVELIGRRNVVAAPM